MESDFHQALKRSALRHLRRQGCLAAAVEVRCPIARFRLDVAGYCDSIPQGDGSAGPRRRAAPRTFIIECKQSREDFLRDCDDAAELLELRRRLDAMRRSIEEHRIRSCEPHLRVEGSSLFAEMEAWDYAASRLPGYRRIMAKLRRLDERIHGETKFFTIARYALADELFLAAPTGMIRRHEVPPGWGLLECEPAALRQTDDPEVALSVAIQPAFRPSRETHRIRLLRNIAAAACGQIERARQSRRPPEAGSASSEIAPGVDDREQVIDVDHAVAVDVGAAG